MKFTLKQFTKKGLVTIGSVNGTWKDLAIKCVELYPEDSEQPYYLAECIEASMENERNDNDYTPEQIAAQDWRDGLDNIADSVMNCNAPFIYNGNGKQINSYPEEVYQTIITLAEAECKAFFDKEEYVKPTFTKKSPTTNVNTPKQYKKANVAGVYAAPTKKEPGRWIANYRANMQTFKLGFYPNQEEAEAASIKFHTDRAARAIK